MTKVIAGITDDRARALGSGKRLFDEISRTDIAFERTAVIESPFATHLRFRAHAA